MTDQNVNPVAALSMASLMLTELTGDNYEVNSNLVSQQSDLMDNESSLSEVVRWTGAIASIGASFMMLGTFASMSGGLKSLSSEMKTAVDFGQGATALTTGTAEITSAGINAKMQVDKSHIQSLQADGQGYLNAGQQALNASQALEGSITQYISSKGQAETLMPVRG